MPAPQLPPQSPVREGQIIAQKYRVENVLGVGGMGAVVRATHVELDQPVALKFMLPEALANAEAQQRFLREAKIVAKLKSEHIARVSDLGTLDTGQPYIVMELLEGSDLRARIDQGPAVSVPEAALYVTQVCEALAEAHHAGIIHRDLKPANLFLTRRPNGRPLVKVLDFGISKGVAMGDASLAATKTNALLGSPYYMSPEQMTAPKDVDHRTDVWSLGVILYELVTGKMPFDADTLGALFLAVYHHAPTPLPQLRPDLPAQFVAIVMRCLEKSPQARFATVEELGAALSAFVPEPTSPGITAPPAGITAPPMRDDVSGVMAQPVSNRSGVPISARGPLSSQLEGDEEEGRPFWQVALVSFVIPFVIGVIALAGWFKLRGAPSK
jgi:serine/threonine-protein kinase